MQHAESLAVRVGEGQLREDHLRQDAARCRLECTILAMTCASLEADKIEISMKHAEAIKAIELLTAQLQVTATLAHSEYSLDH